MNLLKITCVNLRNCNYNYIVVIIFYSSCQRQMTIMKSINGPICSVKMEKGLSKKHPKEQEVIRSLIPGAGENPCCGIRWWGTWGDKGALGDKVSSNLRKWFSPKVSKYSAGKMATFSFLENEKCIKVDILPLLMFLIS